MANLYSAIDFNILKGRLIQKLQNTDTKNLTKNHIIIAPDKYSLGLEKSIFSSLKNNGAFNIEVLTLSRLIYKLKDIDTNRYISLSDAVMIVKKLCIDYADSFKTFSHSKNLNTFSENMVLLINQFKSSGISYADLRNSAKGLSVSFSNKLYDIAFLYEKYSQFLGGKLFDANDLVSELTEQVLNTNYIKNCSFYIIGFDTVTNQILKSFKLIEKYCLELNLFAVSCKNFEKMSEVYKKFKTFNIINSEHICEDLEKQADVLKDNLFGVKINKTAENENVLLYNASGTLDEVNKCVADIRYNVLNNNLKYSDIAVIFTDSKIEKTLQNVLEENAVPFYIENSKTLSSHPLSKLILDILNLKRQNFDREIFLSILKNPILEIDNKSCDIFENYVLKYAINRNKFLSVFEDFEKNENIKDIENTRKYILSIINLLNVNFSGTADNFCVRLNSFLNNKEILKKLENLNNSLKNKNDLSYLGFSQQALKNILKTVQSIEYIFKGTKFSLDEFYKIFYGGLDSFKISLVPKMADSVLCGDYKSIIFSKIRRLYVLGCSSSNYPKAVSESGIIKDEEIEILNSFGLNMEPKCEDINEKEKYFIYSMFLNNQTSLYLSYTANPSSFFTDIKNSFTVKGKPLQVFTNFDFEKELYAYGGLVRYLGLKLKSNLPDKAIGFALPDNLSGILSNLEKTNDKPIKSAIFFKNGKTSVSALETYFSCPYKHFLRYGLNASIRKIAEFAPVDIGQFLHLAVKMYLENNDFEKEVSILSDTIFEKLINLAEYKKYLSDPFTKLALFKLKGELEKIFEIIKNQFKNSAFSPLFVEAKFDSGCGIDALELVISDSKIKLHGVIDRVDVMNFNGQNFVRVIDYKSGYFRFSNSDLQFGKKIQLFIYMHALVKNGYRPFGLYYFPMRVKFSKEMEKGAGDNKLVGQTVDNLELIYLADQNLKNENTSKIFEVKLKDGTIANSNRVISEEEMLEQCEYGVNLCKNAVKEILDGNIDISPLCGVCEFCEYVCVCKNYGAHFERRA